MRIAQIEIERFGAYQQYTMDQQQLAAPITLIYGPNEAGKSTVHAFVRSILFGFSFPKQVDYTPREGTELAGSLLLEDEQGQKFRVTRTTPPHKGKLYLTRATGERVETELLKKIVGYVTDDVYKHIFAFTHQELQHVGHLHNEEITDYLYGTSSGTGKISLLDVEKGARKRREQLFKPRAVLPNINKLLKELEEAEQELQQIKAGLETYFQLQERRKQEQEALASYRAERSRLEKESVYLEKVLQSRALEEELEQLEIRLPLYNEESLLIQNQDKIRSLYQHQEELQQKQEQLVQTEGLIAQLEQQLDREVAFLGGGWSSAVVQAMKLTYLDKEELFEQVTKITAAQEKLQKKKEEAQQEQREVEKLQYQLEVERKRTAIPAEHQQPRGSKEQGSWSRIYLPLLNIFAIVVALGIFLSGPDFLSGLLLLILIGSMLYLFLRRQGLKQEEHLRQQQMEQWSLKYEQWQDSLHEHLHYLEGEYSYGVKRVKQLLEEEQQVKGEYQALLAEWTTLARAKGFPITPSLTSFAELLRRVEALQQEQLQLDSLRREWVQLEASIQAWRSEVLTLQQGVEVAITSEQEEQLIHHIYQLLDTELQQQQLQAELLLQQKQMIAQISRLMQGECDNVVRWRTMLQRKSLEEWQEEKLQLQDSLATNLEQIERAAASIGEYESRLQELESEEQLSYKNQEFEVKKAIFQQQARRWSVLAVAERLCMRTRKIFEEERQPKVILKASHYFKQITAQKYVQIIAPLEQQDFVVVREDGARLSTKHLSQGTKEQLYLAMRFALIEEYAPMMKLPVVMDDIFVNFDSRRVKNALAGVEQLSQTNQILFFTCHEHMVQLMKEQLPSVAVVTL